MQCHTNKIAQKLSIYNRFENNMCECVLPLRVVQTLDVRIPLVIT